MKLNLRLFAVCCGLIGVTGGLQGEELPAKIAEKLEAFNVVWDVPGPTATASMPLGNGDIGLNVWVEPSGDVLFYIGKTDAWSESTKSSRGLLKLGVVRISLSPSAQKEGAPFVQTLRLRQGEIVVREGAVGNGATLKIWVDANHPVIHVEASSDKPITLKAGFETWRTKEEGGISADIILKDPVDRITWYHRNTGGDIETRERTFGGTIWGGGLVTVDPQTLQSVAPAKEQKVFISLLTTISASPEEWLRQVDAQAKALDKPNIGSDWKEHLAWWDQFWNRSWIFVQGGPGAEEVTRGYVLQRFITACAGRGAYPIKFNGSIFTVNMSNLPGGKDKPSRAVSADYRDWGGQYWFQNTRPMYWPLLASGDFDMMLPLFRMYAAILPANTAQVKEYYNHEGAYFAETAPFWGGLKYVGPEVPENWTDHYFTPILELSMMMLDYYEFTGDREFAKDTLLPVASAGITFFDRHFKRDAGGKILLDPDNAIEMFWKVHNPAPDIAGLRAVLPRLISLPDSLVAPGVKQDWVRMLGELPPLPTALKRGRKVLLPYTGEQTAKRRNGENPELYAIYPFRLYGLEKPDLQLALDTFKIRGCTQKNCWSQDPIQAAMLGLAEVAKDYVVAPLTNRDPALKFPAFWAKGNDYMPDQDNGGNGVHGLQQMLMQTEGKKILLLPAWPRDWNADFKLNAPFRTTVQGRVEGGHLVDLVVNPPERRADIMDMSTRPVVSEVVEKFEPNGEVKTVLMAKDFILPLKETKKGEANIPSGAEEFGHENAAQILDDNLNSKYFNRSGGGNNTGFMVALSGEGAAVNALQLSTANDMPGRDPYSVTVEGSNATGSGEPGGKDFVLLYEGVSGLEIDPGRKTWGRVIEFPNQTSYRTYRVLVTETRNNADAAQYSGVRLGSKVSP